MSETLVYRWPNSDVHVTIYDHNGNVFPAGGAYVPPIAYYEDLTDRGIILTFVDGGTTDGPIIPGGGGGASGTAEYIVAVPNGTLPNAHVLTAGSGITVTYSVDGGGNRIATISSTVTGGGTVNPGGVPQNVTKLPASAGISLAYAREDHKHDINTAVPVSVVPGGTNQEGTSSSLARADHVHSAPPGVALTNLTPQPVGQTGNVGTGTAAAREDHVHAHGDEPGGTLHALVTTTVPGFMSYQDKVKLDGVTPGAGSGVALTNVAPQAVSTIPATGTGTAAAREDHIHAHSNLPGGTLHALVTTTVPGFMAFADKVKLDALGTSMFLNVLDAGVTRGTLANNTLRNANRVAFNAAIAQAVSQNLILAIPPGNYEIYGGALLVTSDNSRWLGTTKSQIIQYGTATGIDCPVVHIGAALGSSAVISGVLIDGLSLRYAGTGVAGAHALEFTGVWMSYFANIDIGDVNAPYGSRTSVPWCGVYWDPAVGTLPPFSNVFMNVRVKMFGWRGISMTRNDDGATGQSTGNVWFNTYLSGGENLGTGFRQDLSSVAGSGMVIASGHTQLRFLQLNTEWCATDTCFGTNAVHELEVNGWNIEGIELKQSFSYKCGWIRPYNTRIRVTGLTIYNSTALASNNITAGSAFLCGPNTRISFDTIHADRIVRTGGSTAVFDSTDGGGDDDVHINAGLLYLNAPNLAFDRYSAFSFATAGSGSLFGPLADFHNSTVTVLGDTSETLYAYNTPGIYACSPSATRTKTMSRQFSNLELCRIAPGSTKEFRKVGGAGSLVIANYDGTVLATLTAIGVVRIVFDGSSWNLLSIAADSALAGLALSSTTPAAVAASGAVGTGVTAARDDHVHAHANQAGGSLHAAATTSVAGFLSAADKTILDALQLPSYVALGASSVLGNERILTPDLGVDITDFGAGNAVKVRQTPILGVNRAHTLKGHPGFPGMSGSAFANELQAFGPFVRQVHNNGSTDGTFDSRPWWIELTDSFWGTSEIVGVSTITVRCQGASGHAALPAVMPSFSLRSYAGSTGIENIYATTSDPSASVSAYQTAHSITWFGAAIPLVRGGRWYIRLEGERGANSFGGGGLQFYGLFLDCTYY